MKKIYIISAVVINLGLLFIASSCIRREKPQVYRFLVADETKMYTAFKDGSYWIFEDSATGNLDTVRVTSFTSEIDTTISYDTYIEEEQTVSTYSSYDTANYSYVIKGNSGLVNRIKIKSGDTTGIELCYYEYRGGSRNRYSSSTNSIRFIDKKDSFTTNQNNYKNVKVFLNISKGAQDDKSTYFYWAEGVGIIKKEILDDDPWDGIDNDVWILKEYNVIQ